MSVKGEIFLQGSACTSKSVEWRCWCLVGCQLREAGTVEGGRGHWQEGGRESVRLWTGGWQHISRPVILVRVKGIPHLKIDSTSYHIQYFE